MRSDSISSGLGTGQIFLHLREFRYFIVLSFILIANPVGVVDFSGILGRYVLIKISGLPITITCLRVIKLGRYLHYNRKRNAYYGFRT